MQMTMREAKARFSEAAALAAKGAEVTITKHGQPFVKLVPARGAGGIDLARLEAAREELGLTGRDAAWFDDQIGNPEASRRLLGLDD